MLKRIADLLLRLAPEDITARALEETLADAEHEGRRVQSQWRRRALAAFTVAVLCRVLVAGLVIAGGKHAMGNIGGDIRQALRRLAKTPIFTGFAIVTLALGIGTMTATYAVVRSVLGPPSGVRNADRIVNVYHSAGGVRSATTGFSLGDFEDFRARQTLFESVMAWHSFGSAFAADGQSAMGFAEMVAASYFEVLGVHPQTGRLLQSADDHPTASRVTVIGHGMAQRLFGTSATAIGRTLRINGHPFEIVGVAPREFRGLRNNGHVPTGAWVPIAALPVLSHPNLPFPRNPSRRDDRWLLVKGLLAPGRTASEAAAEVETIAGQLDATDPIGRDLQTPRPMPYQVSRPWSVLPMTAVRFSEHPTTARLVEGFAAALMAAAGIVLLIACTNLANLMLARGSGRRHELAVARSLGASRWRLMRGTLIETALVAALGALAALGVVRILLRATAGEIAFGAPLYVDPPMDAPVFIGAAGVAALALLVAGLAPALQASRADVRAALAAEAGAAPRWRGRRWLIAAQVTGSVALLAIATLAAGELHRQSNWTGGIDLDRLTLADIVFTIQGFDRTRAAELFARVHADLGQQPDVESATVLTDLPIGFVSGSGRFGAQGRRDRFRAAVVTTSPEFTRTLGVPIVHGTTWAQSPDRSPDPPVMISEAMARRLFGRSNVVGQTIQRASSERPAEDAGEPLTVVGVVADTEIHSRLEPPVGVVYQPFDLSREISGLIVVRGRSTAGPLEPAIRKAVAAADPGVALEFVGPAREYAVFTGLYRATSTLAGLLGSFAFLLAIAGLYGVLTQVVLRRHREIGLRMALGATSRDVARMVLGDGLRPVVLGVAAGLAVCGLGAIALPDLFRQLLPSIDAGAAALGVVVVSSLMAAAATACYLPARAASRIDPNVALKEL